MYKTVITATIVYRNKDSEQIESRSSKNLDNQIYRIRSLYDVVEVKLKYFFDMGDGLVIEM